MPGRDLPSPFPAKRGVRRETAVGSRPGRVRRPDEDAFHGRSPARAGVKIQAEYTTNAPPGKG